LWFPLFVFLAGVSTSQVMKYRYVSQIKLLASGKSIEIWTRPLWQSKFNIPIRDIEPIERDELVTLLADNEMLLAHN